MRTREALAVACSGKCVTYVANDKRKADHRFSDILKFLEGLDVRYEARKTDMTVRFPESGGTVRVVCPQRKAGLLGVESDIVLYDELEADCNVSMSLEYGEGGSIRIEVLDV